MNDRDYDDLIIRVKDAVNITSLVEMAGVSVNGKGMGLCPFHEEKTPSFHVDPDKGLYYCHGCQAGGDAIAFHMQLGGMSFIEAIDDLALRHHIPLPANFTPEQKEAVSKENRRREILTQLVDYWHKTARKECRDYAIERWGRDLVDREKIGSASDDMKYREWLGSSGITFDEEKAFGLVDLKKSLPHPLNGCLNDRIIIPDWKGGKVIFIWTRSTADILKKKKDTRPKYLPYAKTDFHPLGGAPLINEQALSGKPKEIWATEGVSKVLTLKQLGIQNVVGAAGVNSLGKHFDKFKDVDRIWLLFDDDPYKPSKTDPTKLISPGNDAAWKYARQFGARARVIELGKLKEKEMENDI